MRSYYKNILLAAALLTAAAACTKEGPGSGTNPLSGVPITVSATAPETKAMLDADAFKQDGNRIIIYDFVDNATDPYFSDLIGPDVNGSDYANSQKPDGVWPFENGPHQWTPGTHNFFGWLVKDVNKTTETSDDLTPADLFGTNFEPVTGTDKNVSVAAFNPTTKTLSIPATDINAASPQFDFMYSDIYSTEPQNDPVDLKFSHLFTAVSFGIKNESSANIELLQVKVMFYTNQSANINYNTEGKAEYTKNYTPFVFASNDNNGAILATLGASGSNTSSLNNIINSTDNQTYYLSWPQTADNLKDCYIYLEYNKRYTNSFTLEKPTVKFPVALGAFEPGKKYHITITIQERADVTIKYLVTDWSTNTVTVPDFN